MKYCMSYWTVLAIGFTGIAILVSYGIVTFDLLGWFPLPTPTASIEFRGFKPHFRGVRRSPYWLGIDINSVSMLILLYGLAGIGYIVWTHWIFSKEERINFTRIPMLVFLLSFLATPYTSYMAISSDPVYRTSHVVLSCASFWLASGGVWWLVAQSFLLRAPAGPLIGILVVSLVVIMVNGVGYTVLLLDRL